MGRASAAVVTSGTYSRSCRRCAGTAVAGKANRAISTVRRTGRQEQHWGMRPSSRQPRSAPAIGSVRRPSHRRTAMGERRRKPPFASFFAGSRGLEPSTVPQAGFGQRNGGAMRRCCSGGKMPHPSGGLRMDIAAWLQQLGLEEYEPAFRANAIDGSVLLTLTAEDLKDLGVALVGHRRKMLNAIAALSAGPTPSQPEPPLMPAGAERRHLTVLFCDL